jgi:hypothetical protein
MKRRFRLALAVSTISVLAVGAAVLSAGAGAANPPLWPGILGYVLASPCVESPAGGMGYHYENAALMADDRVEIFRPEVLLFAPNPTSGNVELVGIEYWKRDADQNVNTDGDRPSLFGRPFNGPMAGHSPVMPVHYDLHVWLFRHNPSGLFADWNPKVSCG